jgi:hypothetical protein
VPAAIGVASSTRRSAGSGFCLLRAFRTVLFLHLAEWQELVIVFNFTRNFAVRYSNVC